MKKVALVLSGGGFKGAFQLGALQYIRDHWPELNTGSPKMKFDIIAGVSVGSLNGVLTALNKFEELEELWTAVGKSVEEIYTSEFIDTKSTGEDLKLKLDVKKLKEKFLPNVNVDNLNIWRGIGMLLSRKKREAFFNNLVETAESDFKENFGKFKSIADNSPLKDKLTKFVRKNDIPADCIYRCGYVSLDNGNYYSKRPADFATDADFVNGILASTAMPLVWTPVPQINTVEGEVNKQAFCVDGGVRNVSPLGDVIGEIKNDASPDEYLIIIINCSSGKIGVEDYKEKNIAQIALRALDDIAITEIFNNDLKEFIDKNFILDQIKKQHPGTVVLDYDFENDKPGKPLRSFKSIIIKPDSGILGNALRATPGLNERRINHGKEKAKMGIDGFKGGDNNFGFTIT